MAAPSEGYGHSGTSTSHKPPLQAAATENYIIIILIIIIHEDCSLGERALNVSQPQFPGRLMRVSRATNRFGDLGDGGDGEPKQVLSLQVDGEELEGVRLGSALGDGAQDLIPHPWWGTEERRT